MEKAKRIRGTRFIHLLSPCSPGWKIPSELTVKISRLAVLTGVFPLYEVEDGEKYTISFKPKRRPVQDYLKLQGRFNHLTGPEIEVIQKNIGKTWDRLLKKAS
jgi:pyruvate/2-oxoacid:ferredoxin oxidoreductase beta subunit